MRSGNRELIRVAAPHLSLAGSQEVSQLPQADGIHEIKGVQSPARARRMEPRFWWSKFVASHPCWILSRKAGVYPMGVTRGWQKPPTSSHPTMAGIAMLRDAHGPSSETAIPNRGL